MKNAINNPFITAFKLLCLSNLVFCFASQGWAIGYVGDYLIIGPNSGGYPNTVPSGSNAAAFGIHNYISNSGSYGYGSVAIGIDNQTDNLSLAVGEGNMITAWSSTAIGNGNSLIDGAWLGSAFGFYNTISRGAACLVAGSFNIFDAGETSYSMCSVLFGEYNGADNAEGCFLSGVNNVADGAVASAAIGLGLTLNSSSVSRVVIGQYNLGDETDAVFVVANGTDNLNLHNALVVHADGTVIIAKPQGDILMGEFGD